jgi:hypothetical protein
MRITNSGAGGVSGILFQALSTGTANTAQATISVIAESASSKNTAITFGTRENSGGTIPERMRLDSAGNLGLGVTPSAWRNIFNAFQVGYTGGVYGATSAEQVNLASNYYQNSAGNELRIQAGFATRYQQASGAHTWSTAASSTAGSGITFTQAMTLDASGNLGVGTTSPATKLHVFGNGNNTSEANATAYIGGGSSEMRIYFGVNNSSTYSYIGSYQQGIAYRDLVLQPNGGNLLVGDTANATGANARLYVLSTSTTSAATFKTITAAYESGVFWNSATSGNNVFAGFYTETSITPRGSITYNRAGGLTVYNTTSDYRAKDISGPVTNSGALIDSIPVYMGKMKWAEQERPMFIAHEVPAYAHTGEKDAVDADGNPVYQQMDASALIPVMWAEIQSLRQRLSAANL